jgi:hypothetical protein
MISKCCFSSFLAVAVFTPASLLLAQEAPRFMVSQEDVEDLEVLKLKDRLSLGVQLYSVVPSARPFQDLSSSPVQDFSYQILGALGVELAYKFSTYLDLGISTAYEFYESRLRLQSGTSSTELRTAKVSLFPISGILRYEWPKKFWAPVLEGGFGVGVFNMSLQSSNLAQAEIKDSSMTVLAHAASGVNFAWLDDTNIGVMLGYRLMFLQQKDFNASTFDIRRKSLSGLYAKASLRYHF